jgi:hypothetical protein
MTGPSIAGQALPVALNLVLSKSQTACSGKNVLSASTGFGRCA